MSSASTLTAPAITTRGPRVSRVQPADAPRAPVSVVNAVRQGVSRALADSGRTIRLPVNVVEQVNQIARAERSLSASLGGDPSAEEIADLVAGITPEKVRAIKHSTRAPISLEKPVGDDEGSEFGQLELGQCGECVVGCVVSCCCRLSEMAHQPRARVPLVNVAG